MAKILYIKATPKTVDDSWTLKMSTFFLQEYQKHHPADSITELDLYQQAIGFLTQQDLHTMMQKEQGDFANYVDQFLAHDKYIIAAPCWNLSFPAILRAYLDHIIVLDKTFYNHHTRGPQPLIVGRKALFFMAYGGIPLEKTEHGLTYWHDISATFLGLDTTSYVLHGTEMLTTDALDLQFQQRKQQLIAQAKCF